MMKTYEKTLLVCKLEVEFVASFDKDAEKNGKHPAFMKGRIMAMNFFDALRIRAGRMPWNENYPPIGGVRK